MNLTSLAGQDVTCPKCSANLEAKFQLKHYLIFYAWSLFVAILIHAKMFFGFQSQNALFVSLALIISSSVLFFFRFSILRERKLKQNLLNE